MERLRLFFCSGGITMNAENRKIYQAKLLHFTVSAIVVTEAIATTLLAVYLFHRSFPDAPDYLQGIAAFIWFLSVPHAVALSVRLYQDHAYCLYDGRSACTRHNALELLRFSVIGYAPPVALFIWPVTLLYSLVRVARGDSIFSVS